MLEAAKVSFDASPATVKVRGFSLSISNVPFVSTAVSSLKTSKSVFTYKSKVEQSTNLSLIISKSVSFSAGTVNSKFAWLALVIVEDSK